MWVGGALFGTQSIWSCSLVLFYVQRKTIATKKKRERGQWGSRDPFGMKGWVTVPDRGLQPAEAWRKPRWGCRKHRRSCRGRRLSVSASCRGGVLLEICLFFMCSFCVHVCAYANIFLLICPSLWTVLLETNFTIQSSGNVIFGRDCDCIWGITTALVCIL